MKIKPIETVYKHYEFRSRLEAKWATFFDLCNWSWAYEPVDFNGWIPDFVIYGANPVYVEVKPVAAFPSDVARKIDRSGCEDEVLIVGQRAPVPNPLDGNDELAFGWIREQIPRDIVDTGGEWVWSDAVMGRWESNPSGVGFCHSLFSYEDRITGKHDGGSWGALSFDPETISRYWAEACNKTKWYPSGNTRQ